MGDIYVLNILHPTGNQKKVYKEPYIHMVSLAWSVAVNVNSPAHGHAATVSLSYTHPVWSPDKHL